MPTLVWLILDGEIIPPRFLLSRATSFFLVHPKIIGNNRAAVTMGAQKEAHSAILRGRN
jgi:hypothetical protein